MMLPRIFPRTIPYHIPCSPRPKTIPRKKESSVMRIMSLSILIKSDVMPFPVPWKRLADIMPGEANG
ncbi:Uncharacterised protein [uncultured archaeon]|nr:Uncharacterised protein [uncultured archaeon]